MTELEPGLLEAYNSSIVTVSLPNGTFKCSPNVAISSVPMELKPCAWVITAHNPQSRVLVEQVNNERQQKLLSFLREGCSTAIYSAEGSSKSGDWSEASFAVVGVSFEEIAALARQFEQNAIYRIDQSGCLVVLV